MAKKFWKVDGEILTPEVLQADPDKHGGMGIHMHICIKTGVVTVPLSDGSCHVSAPVTAEAAQRIAEDGGVDINDSPYWNSIHTAKVFFKGTEEQIITQHGMF